MNYNPQGIGVNVRPEVHYFRSVSLWLTQSRCGIWRESPQDLAGVRSHFPFFFLSVTVPHPASSSALTSLSETSYSADYLDAVIFFSIWPCNDVILPRLRVRSFILILCCSLSVWIHTCNEEQGFQVNYTEALGVSIKAFALFLQL